MGRPIIVAALISAALLFPPPVSPAAPPVDVRTALASLAPGELKLKNTRWDRMQVEVRVGASANCADNPSVGIRTIRRDATWGVVSDEVVCWRREQAPGDASAGWTAWEQARLTPDEVRDVTL